MSVAVSVADFWGGRRVAAWVGVLLLVGCAGQPLVDGPVGERAGTPTLAITGTVDPAIVPTLFVEYVATGTGRRCTRIDGESGRVVATRWLRYPVPVQDGRFDLPVLLDPLDDTGCAYAPAAVYFQARNARTGRTMPGYVGLAGFAATESGGVDRLAPQRIDCQDAFGETASFDCSLPRQSFGTDGRYCTVPRVLDCADGCSATFDFRLVDPPRRETLWAVPEGCPASASDAR